MDEISLAKLVKVFTKGARKVIRKPHLRGFSVLIFDVCDWPPGCYHLGNLRVGIINNGDSYDIDVLATDDFELAGTAMGPLLDYTRLTMACEQCVTEFDLKDKVYEETRSNIAAEARALAEDVVRQFDD